MIDANPLNADVTALLTQAEREALARIVANLASRVVDGPETVTGPNPDPVTFADWLRINLKAKRWTVRDLAQATGINVRTIENWTTRPEVKKNPSFVYVLQIVRALGTDFESVARCLDFTSD